jgi:peptidoglycan hydrolase CwlO-like protein
MSQTTEKQFRNTKEAVQYICPLINDIIARLNEQQKQITKLQKELKAQKQQNKIKEIKRELREQETFDFPMLQIPLE